MSAKPRSALCTLVIALLTGLFGCSGSPPPPPPVSTPDPVPETGLFTSNFIVIDRVTRRYDFFVPGNLGPTNRPLVFLFHGGGSNTDDLTGESGFKAPYKVWMDIAEAERFVVVFPQGVISPLGAAGWNDCRADATTNPAENDVKFVDALIGQFSTSHNVDLNRIYASGTSNGGNMSLRLALELSDRIAAVAPVVAAMPAISCNVPVNPISVLFMNGTADPLLPYGGGEVAPKIGGRGTVLSAEDSIRFWVAFNQTDATPAVVAFTDINFGDNSTVSRYTYSNGAEGTQVVLYEVAGGGHVEPSVQEQYSPVLELILGPQNHDMEMAQEIWGFFKDKTLH